ncbi:SRPBCC family protein [Actinomadura macrotermitis]|uniref:Coenzyme Q-binding protein COQ10 START domain-containing protein n=1 Tax=Actinomadura macrotermitis TaxID=2585200 RepID=A0A7K0C3U4_9ACTN|nr:SRPBCC family protein [Actinomadura macrotermitis]MQY08046.1 hypothetical protein [Actinomadura macrotermitis]
MSTIEHSVDVDVPVRVAYDQWTRFGEFPRFMDGVDAIEQISETRTRWHTSIAGVNRDFDAETTEQIQDQRVAWVSLDKPRQAGAVTFSPLGADRTRIRLEMDFEPEGAVEKIGDALNLVDRRVKGDLERFKEFIESADRPADTALPGEPAPPVGAVGAPGAAPPGVVPGAEPASGLGGEPGSPVADVPHTRPDAGLGPQSGIGPGARADDEFGAGPGTRPGEQFGGRTGSAARPGGENDMGSALGERPGLPADHQMGGGLSALPGDEERPGEGRRP